MTVSATAPSLLWSDSGLLVQGGFAVGGGGVFFCTHAPGHGGDNALYAIDQQKGTMLWQRPTASSTGDPAYANGVVYLQSAGGLNMVQGWNVQTQAQTFSASYSNQANTYLAPVISNGSLYAGGGYYGGQVYSYNVSTSALNWTTTAGNGSYGNASPAVDAHYVYAPGGSGSALEVFDRGTGARISEVGPRSEALSGTPLLTGNGGLFYSENGNGYYYDISNPAAPKLGWTLPQVNGSGSAYANGVLYGVSGQGSSSTLYAVDAATGAINWLLAGVSAPNNMVVTDNTLFAAEGSRTVAINLQTHAVMWSVPTAGSVAVSDGELFIGSQGSVVAYAIPEPSSLLLLAPGASLFLRRRRGAKAAVPRSCVPGMLCV